MPPRTRGANGSQGEFYSPIVKAACDETSSSAEEKNSGTLNGTHVREPVLPPPADALVLKGIDGEVNEDSLKDSHAHEADMLRKQVADLHAKFAAERSRYEILLSPHRTSKDDVASEIGTELGEQQGRVGDLKQQLDYVIDRLGDLQESYDNAEDGDPAQAGPPFEDPNERDDATTDRIKSESTPTQTNDNIMSLGPTSKLEQPIKLQICVVQSASNEAEQRSKDVVKQLQSSVQQLTTENQHLSSKLEEERASSLASTPADLEQIKLVISVIQHPLDREAEQQSKERWQQLEHELEQSQAHLEQLTADNEALTQSLQLQTAKAKASEAQLAEKSSEVICCRESLAQMQESSEESCLTSSEQGLLLGQCISNASTQQALDRQIKQTYFRALATERRLMQMEELDKERKHLISGFSTLDSLFDAVEAQIQHLDSANDRLASQQDQLADRLLYLTDVQEQMAGDRRALQSQAEHLSLSEAQLSADRAVLTAKTTQLLADAAAVYAELETKTRAEDVCEISSPASSHRSGGSEADEANETDSYQQAEAHSIAERVVDLRSEEEAHARAAFAALEGRQRELEAQKHHLQQRHRQLAEDLSTKQMGLNEQWAALDIDQSRAEAREQSLKSQSAEMQSKWQILEEEWLALEAQKAQLSASQPAETPSDPSNPSNSGQLVSVSSEAATENSHTEVPLQLSEEEIAAWRASLDKQLVDIAAEWAAVNAERGRLGAEREALRVREEAVAKAESGGKAVLCDPFGLKLVEVPLGVGAVACRGDSPRDLTVRKVWSEIQDGSNGGGKSSEGPSASEHQEESKLDSKNSASSTCGFTYIKDRAEKLRHERTKLWATATDPDEMQRRMKRIHEMEQLQSQREMMLEAREAIDVTQLEEMNLARSLALDNREKLMQQQEKDQKEACAKLFNRDEEMVTLRRKIQNLEQQLRQAEGAEFAAIRSRCGVQNRKNKSWARVPEKGSLLDPLWQQGLDIEQVYGTNGSI